MEDPGAAQFDNATVDSALREAITDQDVDAVRRLLATPGYRFPATPTAVFSLLAAQSVTVGHGRSAHADPSSVQLYRRRGREMLLALVAACDEETDRATALGRARCFCSSASTPGRSKRGARRRRARCCFYDGSSPDSIVARRAPT